MTLGKKTWEVKLEALACKLLESYANYYEEERSTNTVLISVCQVKLGQVLEQPVWFEWQFGDDNVLVVEAHDAHHDSREYSSK